MASSLHWPQQLSDAVYETRSPPPWGYNQLGGVAVLYVIAGFNNLASRNLALRTVESYRDSPRGNWSARMQVSISRPF